MIIKYITIQQVTIRPFSSNIVYLYTSYLGFLGDAFSFFILPPFHRAVNVNIN